MVGIGFPGKKNREPSGRLSSCTALPSQIRLKKSIGGDNERDG
jgi:hypothetical protein